MAGILDLLNSDLGKTLIGGMSGHTKQDSSKTATLLKTALPLLMVAMRKNAASKEGASGLLSALNGKHDGGILDKLGNIFGEGDGHKEVEEDGGKILGHLFGNKDKQKEIEHHLGKESGVDSKAVSTILKVAAPILMGVLASKIRTGGASNNSEQGLTGLLDGFLGKKDKASEASGLLDGLFGGKEQGKSSILDLLGGGKEDKGADLGDLLGGIFGKR